MPIKVNKTTYTGDSVLKIWHDMTPDINSVVSWIMLMRMIQNQRNQAKG
jgi:hypothetical protein